jgi:hypothetical protein
MTNINVPAVYPTTDSTPVLNDEGGTLEERFPMSRCVTTPGSKNDDWEKRYVIDTSDDAVFLANSYNARSSVITKNFDKIKLIDFYVTGNDDAPGTVTVRRLPKKGHPYLDGYRTAAEIEFAHAE